MVDKSSAITFLSVGPKDEHHASLAQILNSAELYSCSSPDRAVSLLRKKQIPIVLCDCSVDWRRLLEELRELSDPPFLIVASRLADDRLWCEALHLGAYDVLAKPFERAEVTRVLNMAWTRWTGRSTRPFRVECCDGLTQMACA